MKRSRRATSTLKRERSTTKSILVILAMTVVALTIVTAKNVSRTLLEVEAKVVRHAEGAARDIHTGINTEAEAEAEANTLTNA